MTESNITKRTADTGEVTIKDLLAKLKSGIRFIKTQWLFIMIIAVIGGALGLTYAFLKKPRYTASCTFVLEDGSKGGGLGQYAGLASIAGIDIGGGGGGVFQGDNILELYKSRLMIKKTLLSKMNLPGSDQMLIDKYIDFNNLKKSWAEDAQLKNINFNGDQLHLSRKQDSLLTAIIDAINKTDLVVTKPDKKLSIIRADYVSKNELFSKIFVERLVENVNDFYVQTKTKKSERNVKILEHQKDSVRRLLDLSIGGVASAIDAAPNANPALLTLRVPSQKRQVDVQASSAVYSEIVRNLEIAKVSLLQETPLIQIIDEPVLPLPITKVSKLKGILLGLFIGGFFAVVFVSIKKILSWKY